jgi:hypothetical protein
MPFIKNVSPLGDLEVALLGRVVKAGEVVEVTTEQVKQLGANKPQERFEVVDAPKKESK